MSKSAFPITQENGANSGDVGMLLRDYFAAKAMQGFISASVRRMPDDYYAQLSYEIADAMLKARND